MLNSLIIKGFLAATALCVASYLIGTPPSFAQETSPRLAPSLEDQASLRKLNDDAEVLYALEKAEFDEDGNWQQLGYYSIRINSLEAARDYGRIVIPFDHYYSDIHLDFANARSARGKITAVSEDAVQHRITGGGQDFYSDSSELVFSLPNVVPGSIIEFQYTQRSKNLAFPALFSDNSTPWYFQRKVGGDGWRGDLVHHYHYELVAPQNKKLHFKYFNQYPQKVKKRSTGGKDIYSWEWRKVKPFYTEAWMPPFHQVASMLHVSTLDDWSAVDRWTWEKVKDKIQPSNELKKIINSLQLPKHASREEKIRAVYGYMQNNIRYVFAHLGRGGYEPHFPDDVLKANYGDCKDQTVTAIALLRMLGIPALPALIETPNSGKSDTSLVHLIFDHMIVYIPEDDHGPAMYMDTTGDRGLFPGISNYLRDQNTLIIDGKGGKFTKMQHDFAPDFAHLKIRYHSDENNYTQGNIEIELSGFFEQNTRSWWVNSNERETNLVNFIKGLYSSALDFDVEARVLNAEDLWQPARIEAKVMFKEMDDEQNTRAANFNQINYLFGVGSLPLPDTRRLPFYDDSQYNLYMTVDFLGKENQQALVFTRGNDIETPWFSLKQSGRDTDSGYRVQIQFEKRNQNLTLPEYSDYYAAVSQLGTRESWLVGFQNVYGNNDLASLKQTHGENSLEYLTALAERHIELGDFELALAPAQQAVNNYQSSGKAWYILGLARGFNSQIQASKDAFARARSLGYSPWQGE